MFLLAAFLPLVKILILGWPGEVNFHDPFVLLGFILPLLRFSVLKQILKRLLQSNRLGLKR